MITKDNVKVGTELIAIDECILPYSSKGSLIINKRYIVDSVSDNRFMVYGEHGRSHYFLFDDKFFKLSNRENQSIEGTIKERGNKYGSFTDGSKIMRQLKEVMHNTDGWAKLSEPQKEALDMIQHKIGRILNGDPNYDDSWIDVAGYAELIVKQLHGENP